MRSLCPQPDFPTSEMFVLWLNVAGPIFIPQPDCSPNKWQVCPPSAHLVSPTRKIHTSMSQDKWLPKPHTQLVLCRSCFSYTKDVRAGKKMKHGKHISHFYPPLMGSSVSTQYTKICLRLYLLQQRPCQLAPPCPDSI